MSIIFFGLQTIAAIFLLLWMMASFKVIRQTELAIVETLGKFSRVHEAGWCFVWAPFQLVVARLDTQIKRFHEKVSVKTSDSQFIKLDVTILTQVVDAYKAHYKLSNPENIIKDMVLNIVRPTASKMTLETLFNDRDHLMTEIKKALQTRLNEFGYQLVDVLVDQPQLSKEAEETFNNVLLAEKKRQAATFEAEANQILVEGQARAEAESQRLRAEGLAQARKVLANSLKESLEGLEAYGRQEAVQMLIETNRIDMLRTVAKESNNLIILDTTKDVPVIVNKK